MVLPVFLGVNGVWLSVPVTEFLSFIVSWYYLITKRNNYGYI
jgi:Na+-driven multidrug efflux pump